MAIINGRRVTNVPNAGVYGADIIQEMDIDPGRGPVFIRSEGNERIDPKRRYSKRDLLDRKGQPLKVSDIPDRSKGDEALFGGRRSHLSKRIIWEQVIDLAEHRFVGDDIDFDEADSDWMVIKSYRLPQNWWHIARFTPLLIVFPTAYPTIPPVGCYMKETIPQSANGHFFTEAYHSADRAPLSDGWKWYCVYVQPGAWKPATVRKPGDWRSGDNIWTYLDLINEALASPQ
jgi:hypothetical protein